MKRKQLFVAAIVILSLLSLGLTYLWTNKVVSKAVLNDSGDFVLQSPYDLDSRGYLKVDSVLGLIQYHWPSAPPNALCNGIDYQPGQSYPYTYGSGWPLNYLYQSGVCSPTYQLVIIPLLSDFLFFLVVYTFLLGSAVTVMRHSKR